MGRTRRVVVVLLAGLTLAAYLAPVAGSAPNCSPGQHGNPHPGFKPGNC